MNRISILTLFIIMTLFQAPVRLQWALAGHVPGECSITTTRNAFFILTIKDHPSAARNVKPSDRVMTQERSPQETHPPIPSGPPSCDWRAIIRSWLNPSSHPPIPSWPITLSQNRKERLHLFQAIRESLSRAEWQLFSLDIQHHRSGPVGYMVVGHPDCPAALRMDINLKTTRFRLIPHETASPLPYATIQRRLIKPLLNGSHATIEAETFLGHHYSGIFRIEGDFSRLMNRMDRTLKQLQWEPDAWVALAGRRGIRRGCRQAALKEAEQDAVPASAYLMFSRPGYRMEWTFAADRTGTSLIVTIDYIREESLQTEPGTCPPEDSP